MAMEFDFDGYWEGDVVYQCDNCKNTHRFPFTSEEEAKDYRNQKSILTDKYGWTSTKVNGRWHDFCSEECRNRYIRLNTL
jgi:hypothetical protein